MLGGRNTDVGIFTQSTRANNFIQFKRWLERGERKEEGEKK